MKPNESKKRPRLASALLTDSHSYLNRPDESGDLPHHSLS